MSKRMTPQPVAVACYECLLTYSNQLNHRHIDRRLLPNFLSFLASAKTTLEQRNDRDEKYERLQVLVDPNSSLEQEFLRFLYDEKLRLPDNAQNRPHLRRSSATRFLTSSGMAYPVFACLSTDHITMMPTNGLLTIGSALNCRTVAFE